MRISERLFFLAMLAMLLITAFCLGRVLASIW